MFSGNKLTEGLQQLVEEIKEYLLLQKQYVKLDVMDKMTILLSRLILGIIFFILASIAVLFLSITFTVFLESITGNLTVACLITTLIVIALFLCIYILRVPLIEKPMMGFIRKLLETDNETRR